MPPSLTKKIRNFYSTVWSKADLLQNERNILLEIPFPLRAAATEHITTPLWEQTLALSNLSRRHWQHIARRLQPEWFMPGMFLAHSEGQGTGEGVTPEIADLWILERGKVACVKDGKTTMTLAGPQVFGCSLVIRALDPDFSLETDTTAYMSVTPVWLWRINRNFLGRYLKMVSACVHACVRACVRARAV